MVIKMKNDYQILVLENKVEEIGKQLELVCKFTNDNTSEIIALSKKTEQIKDDYEALVSNIKRIDNLLVNIQNLVETIINQVQEFDKVKSQVNNMKKVQNVLLSTADFHSNQIALDNVKLANVEKKIKKINDIEAGTLSGTKVNILKLEINNIKNEMENIKYDISKFKSKIKSR
jgi:predicted RNase H-like nuclease (RuvC/YqgF family)